MPLTGAIETGLKDQNPNVRLAAVILAGQTAQAGFAKSLAALLSDKHWQVREKAAWALGRIGNPAVVPALMRLMGANETIIRKKILDVLGGQAPAEDANEKSKEEEPLPVRRAAAMAIASLDPNVVVNTLLQAAESANPSIKVAAMAGLANVQAKAATPLVMASLNDSDLKVREAAITAAGKLKLNEAVPVLIGFCDDERWTIRHEAVIALNHIKAEEAFEALVARLEDQRNEVRRVAIMAVCNTRRPEAVNLIRPFMAPEHSIPVRRAAISSLAALGANDTLEEVAMGLGDADESIRQEAAKAVLKLAERG